MASSGSRADHVGMTVPSSMRRPEAERRLLEAVLWFARRFLLGMSMAAFVTALLLLVLAA
jgi:hypothetical protein